MCPCISVIRLRTSRGTRAGAGAARSRRSAGRQRRARRRRVGDRRGPDTVPRRSRPCSRRPPTARVLKTFFTSAMNSTFVRPADREQPRIADVDVPPRRQAVASCASTPTGRSLPIASLFSSRLLRTFTGMPLAIRIAMPNWLLFRIAPADPVHVDLRLATMLATKVWRWSRMFGPWSRLEIRRDRSRRRRHPARRARW